MKIATFFFVRLGAADKIHLTSSDFMMSGMWTQLQTQLMNALTAVSGEVGEESTIRKDKKQIDLI